MYITPPYIHIILSILRYIISISSVIMLIVIAYFMRGLSWNTEKDRASIVGFTWMMITIVGSAILMWI